MPYAPRLCLALLLVCSTASWAQDPAPTEETEPRDSPKKDDERDEEDKEDEPEPVLTERVVVSASAATQSRLDAPAAVDVLAADDLSQRAGDHFVDQLRRIPGINVVQFSARDVNIASRSATGGINNSTLAVADGRSLYQDFLGFVMWEFAPTDMELVDRVEVVRGPASSLWGANAVGGLVHLVTKSPRDTLGGQVRVEAGSYASRRVDFRHSFLSGEWAIRGSGSLYRIDAFERPQTITNMFGETIDPDFGLLADDFRDSGTEQPRFDLRADRETNKGTFILQGGAARTRGWIATGLGPFDIEPSTGNAYVQGRWKNGPFEAQLDYNYFDGAGKNLINAIDFGFRSARLHASFGGKKFLGRRAVLGYGADASNTKYDLSIAPGADERNIFSAFAETDVKLSQRWWLATGARADHFKETIGTVVSPRIAIRFKPEPRHTVRMAWGRAFRSPSVLEEFMDVPVIPVALIDWGEVDQDLFDAGILDPNQFPMGFFEFIAINLCQMVPDNCGVAPGESPIYVATTAAMGSLNLKEERTTSFEVGWTAQFNRFEFSASAYATESKDGIDFPQVASYGVGPDGLPVTADDIELSADPDMDGIDEAPPIDMCPLGFDLFPEFVQPCTQGPVTYPQVLTVLLDGQIPSLFQYRNGSKSENRGFEVGTGWHSPRGWSASLNYSWQDTPVSDGVSMDDRLRLAVAEDAANADLDGDGLIADTADFVNIPAEHRISFSAQIDRGKWFSGLTVDHVDDSFWQDVLTSDFWGWVPDYTLVGLRAGLRLPRSRITLTGQVTNLLGDEIQQHIFGDRIGRRATLGMRYSWEGRGDSAP
ncbi:MAG: TonB-dependent receptor [Acidobacteria bacterium]|nr:TonB-dependent receptor [Acidobacteriota bacterium]NIM60701.1 TonB-dependent receptor [Acidobacteriota bacterium]NIO58661.1 TonB-dependent receptor [Acidobacteriota bacterium]NIQ29717.1 TonB-dependent receptor [Acidobacteriota bacterium]NIQ84434.1 TonB-dependent receptor [Acidobacteriota bacterium]